MVDFDNCPDCDPLNSNVVTILPEGWQKMSDATRDYHTSVKCECGKILKYAGTRMVKSTEPFAKYGFKWAT